MTEQNKSEIREPEADHARFDRQLEHFMRAHGFQLTLLGIAIVVGLVWWLLL